MFDNEAPSGRIFVRFGQLDHQEITVDVAAMVLTMWRDRNPAQFGAVLAEVMTGARPSSPRGRKAAAP